MMRTLERTKQPSPIALAFVPKPAESIQVEIPRCHPFDPLLRGTFMLTGNEQSQHVRSDGLLQLRHVHGAGTA